MRSGTLILGQLTDDDVEWVLSSAARRMMPRGSILIREGEDAEAVYIVMSGLFTVESRNVPGVPLAQLGKGEVIGEMSMIDRAPPSATVKAAEDSIVLSIDKLQLAHKLEVDCQFASRFYRALAIALASRMRRTIRSFAMAADNPVDFAVEQDLEVQVDESVLSGLRRAGPNFDRLLQAALRDVRP